MKNFWGIYLTKKVYCRFFLLTILLLGTLSTFNALSFQTNYTLKMNVNNSTLSSNTITVTHPADLKLTENDSTNHTLVWNLIKQTTFDYLGVYSFTDDAVGGDPTGWTVTEPVDTHMDVVLAKDNHRKVIEMYKTTEKPEMVNIFTPQSVSTQPEIEFWVWGDSNARGCFNTGNGGFGSHGSIWFWLNFTTNKVINIYNMGASSEVISSALTPNQWHHFRVKLVTSSTFEVWLDGVSLGIHNQFVSESSVDRLCFAALDTTSSFYLYIDAIDYSWAPGYYTSRNMEYGPVDYLGLYSFTDDAVGGDPAGWTVTEPVDTHMDVVLAKDNHRKVIEMYKTTEKPEMVNIFTPQSVSTQPEIEFWVWGDSNARGCFNTGNGGFGSHGSIWFWLNFTTNKVINIYNTGASSEVISNNLTPNQWHHFRVKLVTSSTFEVWLDGVSLGIHNQFVSESSVDRLCFAALDTTSSFYLYIDAIDYSWASGYSTNRNMGYASIDYLGLYSFTDDAVGGDPAGWIVTEPVDTHMDVVLEKTSHRKVVEMYKTTDKPEMVNIFTPQSVSTQPEIEFWVWGDSNARGCFNTGNGGFGTHGSIWFWLNFTTNKVINIYNMGANSEVISSDLTPNQWHHFRVKLITSSTFEVWLDGVSLGIHNQFVSESSVDRLCFAALDTTSSFYLYIDAIDYSWASGYYTSRNMDYAILTQAFAIFKNGTLITEWQLWKNEVQIAYNVSGLGLGVGIHNISLIFNDTLGQWFHDDVIITVEKVFSIPFNELWVCFISMFLIIVIRTFKRRKSLNF